MGNYCCCCGVFAMDDSTVLRVLDAPTCPPDWNDGVWPDYCGKIPARPNVSWKRTCEAPAAVAFSTFLRHEKDGGSIKVDKDGESDTSDFPQEISNGSVIWYGGATYELVAVRKGTYTYTYRVFKSKAPLFRGVKGVIEFKEVPGEPERSVMHFNGYFDNVVPCAVLAFLTKFEHYGPVCSKAAKEYKTGTWKEKYNGPSLDIDT
jgi:hypothetical protein